MDPRKYVPLRALAVALAAVLFMSGAAWADPQEDKPGSEKQEPKAGAAAPRARAPQVGEEAPLFTLTSPDGKREVSLASFRGKRPVALFFGSYT